MLVIGAGPAGSACAQRLASAGIDVVLVDQHRFPRDKICGDGLIPDAHAALRALGVYDEAAAPWQPAQHIRCAGPRGKHCDVPGSVSVLPRKVLDDVRARCRTRRRETGDAAALRGAARRARRRRTNARRRRPPAQRRRGARDRSALGRSPPAPCRRR
ncbi:MAG: FAD-dependent monooxygenase [Rubrivivax sp.]